MNNLYNAVEKFVTDSYTKEGVINHSVKHLERTVHWLKEINPNADEGLLLAALSHDIERAFRGAEGFEKVNQSSKGMRDEGFLSMHQDEGGKIMAEFLLKNGADQELANRVKTLIEKHEVGGTEDQNMLKDADSVSFFENNIDVFVTEKVKANGKEKIRDKFNWMYERISSETAKKIAKPWYDEAIKRLDDI